ncbi:capsular biosynthesis protein [Limnohabitans sp. 2KL-1]|uniref:HAD-IIIC family phosphatase n=1 Tax=Limnohabitans sp. 2KL-1 TaxID=1100699 RepID=UPI000D3A7590|nr:HAD-IIIC family phosphatase [Limnohabitans sp. 2KL-1]PUE48065.1 capsular biosynthesis protein [Limnohabitans sp. 2KL-1]
MRRLVLDLDGTLTVDQKDVPYALKVCRTDVVDRLWEYKRQGFAIVIYTARNMQTFASSVGHINAHTLPVIVDWLQRHNVPYDEIHVGKPWCGHEGFYVDDKAIRPSEFLTLDHPQLLALLAREHVQEPAQVPAHGL